ARSCRWFEARGAAHAGQQLGMLADDLRLDLDRLADRVDARVERRHRRRVLLAGLVDRHLEAMAFGQPRQPARWHVQAQLERAIAHDVHERLADVDALVLADMELRDTPRERRPDPALGDLHVGQLHLRVGPVDGGLRDLHLDLAGRLERRETLLRLEVPTGGGEFGAADLEASLLLGAIEGNERGAGAKRLAQATAEAFDAP